MSDVEKGPLPPCQRRQPVWRKKTILTSMVLGALTLLALLFKLQGALQSSWSHSTSQHGGGRDRPLHNDNTGSLPPHPKHKFSTNGLNMGPPNKNPTLTPNTTHLKSGQHGAVASDIEECSVLGGRILLQKNGNAADAAVTVALCIGLINSFSSGIGGGAYIVSSIHNPEDGSNDLLSIDAREQAPAASYKDMFNNTGNGNNSKVIDDPALLDGNLTWLFSNQPSRFGGLAVGVPGELKGLYHLYKAHGSGRVSWKELIEPVIDLAENGWEASSLLEMMLNVAPKIFQKNYKLWPMFVTNYDQVYECEKRSASTEEARQCYSIAKLVSEGDVVKRPRFAETLRLIANNGSDAIFYDPQGPIVTSLVKTIQDHGGIAVAQDFADYKLKVGTPKSTKFLDKYEVLVPHSGSSSGIAVLSGINIMNRFFQQHKCDPNFAVGGDLTETQTQRLVEAMKWMGSARTKLGDVVTKSDALSQQSHIDELLSDEWADSAFNNISDDKTLDSWKKYKPEFQPVNDNGTAHFSIIDQYNNSISMTTSVNLLFGSFLHDQDTGIILNDQMDDFSIPSDASNAFDLVPSIYNYIHPRKRPLSSMLPAIVFRHPKGRRNQYLTIAKKEGENEELALFGSPFLAVGAAGGSRIFTSVFQAIVRKCMYQMPLLETIAYPRLHHQLLPEVLYMENRTGTAFKEQMRAKGHRIEVTESKSVMNGVARHSETGEWHAVSDWWRKHGVAWAF